MMVEHIDDIREEYRKKLLPFIKFYSKLSSTELPQFMNKDSELQTDIYNMLLVHNSELEELLRDIMEDELNGDSGSRTTSKE